MNFGISNVRRIQFAKVLQAIGFWIPIAFLYYKAHGYSDEQVFLLLSHLQLFMVVMEYPTGVIGDVFGHKLSVLIGYILGAIVFLILGSTLSLPFWATYVILFFFATGASFISGSDLALLHSVSKDFKNDLATMNQLVGWFSAVGLIIGGLVGAIDLRIPFALNGIAFIFASLLILSVRVEKKVESEESGMFETAILGMKEAIFNMKIFLPIFISSVIVMYLVSEKWVLPTVFETSGVPLALFGVATALVTLVKGQASGIYRKIGFVPYWLLTLLMVLSSILISFPYISLLGLTLVYGIGAYIQTQADITINDEVDGRARSSVMSFRNLFARFLNSPYLWIISIASTRYDFSGVNIAMSIVLLLFISITALVYWYRVRDLEKGTY